MRFLSIIIALCFVLFACSQSQDFLKEDDSLNLPLAQQNDSVTRLAFFGDQSINSDAKRVLKLVESQQVDAVIVLGDFGYGENTVETSKKWMKLYDDILGEDFLTIGVIGNHDVSHWGSYKSLLEPKLRAPANCTGLYGEKMYCEIDSVGIVLSGVGTKGEGHEAYITQSLLESQQPWKICAWHKNQNKMQTGSKANEVGWTAYELCRENGALIMTGHEHAYARTYVLSSMENQTIVSTQNDPVVSMGETFAVVSGIGGHSVRVQNEHVSNQDWWARVYTKNQQAKAGVLFCDFPKDITKREAECQFINIEGEVVDSFNITRE